VLTEVSQPLGAEQRRGRRRHEHLPAVRRCRDARRPVHVDPDVSLVGEMRRSGVQADSHADRAGFERGLRVGCRGERTGRRREGDEERVSLRVDLDAPVCSEGAP